MSVSCWTVAIRIVGLFPRSVSISGRPCAMGGCASVCGFPGFRCVVCFPRPGVNTCLFSLPSHHVGVEPPPPPPWMGMVPAHGVPVSPHGFSCMGWMSLPNIRWLGMVGAVDPIHQDGISSFYSLSGRSHRCFGNPDRSRIERDTSKGRKEGSKRTIGKGRFERGKGRV